MNSAASAFAQNYGPWVLVTGASDGIGRAFAAELAQREVHVVLVARRQWRPARYARVSLRPQMTVAHAEDPQVVARAGLDALGRTGTVRPGFLAKLLGYSLGVTPRWGRVKIMGKVMTGMARQA